MEQAAIPRGWVARLEKIADLDASFGELAGYRGFFAEALRGRLRSLQVRISEADDHFMRAARMIARERPSLSALYRALTVSGYMREHAILRGSPLPAGTRVAVAFAHQTEILGRIAENLRALDATEKLYDGDAEESLRIFRELLEGGTGRPEKRALWAMGAAVAEHNCGRTAAALRHLEVASLFVATIERTLGAARLSGKLAAVYCAFTRAADAKDWLRFLDRLPCPDSTKDAMLRRGEIMLARSERLRRVVLV